LGVILYASFASFPIIAIMVFLVEVFIINTPQLRGMP
jgi:hypothetical protein